MTQPNPPKSSPDDLPDVVRFLLGEAALDNCWYGAHPLGQKPYWWRKALREAWNTRAAQPQLTQENPNVSEGAGALHKTQREAGDMEVCPSCGSLPCDQAQKPDDRGMVMWRALQALKECQSIIADMSDPNKVDERTSVNVLWARCVAADRKALSAISELTYYAGGKNA